MVAAPAETPATNAHHGKNANEKGSMASSTVVGEPVARAERLPKTWEPPTAMIVPKTRVVSAAPMHQPFTRQNPRHDVVTRLRAMIRQRVAWDRRVPW